MGTTPNPSRQGVSLHRVRDWLELEIRQGGLSGPKAPTAPFAANRATAQTYLRAAFDPNARGALHARLRDEATRCAAWSDAIATRVGKHTDTALMSGLLHRIGGPVVLDALDRLGSELDVVIDEVDALLLMREYGAEVGATVAEAWALPAPVCAVIASGGDLAYSSSHRDAVAITRAARTFCEHLVRDAPGLPAHPALKSLGLDSVDVATLLSRAEAVQVAADAISNA